MLRLDLRQNALHTLHHAVEHLAWSQDDRDWRVLNTQFDHSEHSVQLKNEAGQVSFEMPKFTRLPPVYGLKFALLHLIQAVELLLKTYVEQLEPAALFERAGSRKTISLQNALSFTLTHNPALLDDSEIALLLQAKDLRNAIEHYRNEFAEGELRSLCIDFLGLCIFLSERLLGINVHDAFSWDYLRGKPDEVATYLAATLQGLSEVGKAAVRRAGESWLSRYTSEPAFACLHCGARSVPRDRPFCMGCGAEGDEEISTLVQELDELIAI